MRVKLTALVGSLLGAAAILLTAAISMPAAQAATLSPASRAHPSVRAYTAKVTLKVRCGKFVGEIDHGGNGGLLDPAYLAVKGKLSSSCNSKTYLQVKYQNGFIDYGPTTIATAGARKTVDVDWQTKSVIGTYAHIAARVGTTDGMPKGKILWAPWKNV